jgi:2-methylisocitrate lyase-like PEP mutase family enzyme
MGTPCRTDRLLATIRAITRVIAIPLSVHLKGRYSDDPIDVAELAARVLDEGVVGINIEDGRSPPELLAAKIEQLKGVAARAHVDLFVNARTDVYLQGLVDAPQRLAETLRRAKCYRDAGADGLFAPLMTAPEEIRASRRSRVCLSTCWPRAVYCRHPSSSGSGCDV